MTTTNIFVVIIVTCAVTSPLAAAANVRGRRADDVTPLEPVVAALSQKVDQMSAQISQLLADNTQLKIRLNAVEQPVAFWVRFSEADQSNLSPGQTLNFDNILYNAGSAYDHNTGVFTATSPGTYFFIVRVMTHAGDVDNTELFLVHNGVKVADAWASGLEYNEGMTDAILHLQVGDTVLVQFGGGHDHTLWGAWHTSFSGFKIAN